MGLGSTGLPGFVGFRVYRVHRVQRLCSVKLHPTLGDLRGMGGEVGTLCLGFSTFELKTVQLEG